MADHHFYVATDLEGVAGVDSWTQTRSGDAIPEQKAAAMDQLARETNACVAGIREVYPDARIDVLDGHGSGGLRKEDLEDATYLENIEGDQFGGADYDALYFTGRHAMAGAPFAPLRHTQSSTDVEYYKLNGTFIGETGWTSTKAGLRDFPAAFLAGDDKACLEIQQFVPEIETVTTKRGLGEQAADHLDEDEACDRIREGAARATRRYGEIPPLTGFEPPFTVELRLVSEEIADDWAGGDRWSGPEIETERIDGQTVRFRSDDFTAFH
jgi:D-amino peptidase